MGTINDKLDYLNNTKLLLKQTMVDKGAYIPDGTPFRKYIDILKKANITWTNDINLKDIIPLIKTDTDLCLNHKIIDDNFIINLIDGKNKDIIELFNAINISYNNINIDNININYELPKNIIKAFYIDNTHLGIEFNNPIKLLNLNLDNWIIKGGLGGNLIDISLYSIDISNNYLILNISSLQSYDTDFLIGYNGSELVSQLDNIILNGFTISFTKTTDDFIIKKITASSEFSSSYPALNLINTDLSTFWAPADAAIEPELYIYFNKLDILNGYTMIARKDNISGSPKAWTISVLLNNKWVVIDNQNEQTWGLGEEKTFILSEPVYCSILKMTITEFNSTGYKGFSKFKIAEV